jgi:hypothetical protein
MRTAALAAAAAAAAAVIGLAACGGPSAGPESAPSDSAQPTTAAAPAPRHSPHHSRSGLHHPRNHRGAAAGGLLAVHDPGTVTGTLTGPCRTRDGGLLPDPSCTPGAIDPAVTQADIQSTICRAGYTDSVRPPEAETEVFKWDVAEPAYGQHEVSGELDHLVPLELGGDNDARNLWVEAGPIPNAKDAVENALNHAVCDGQITLRAAQREIARNWISAAGSLGISVSRPAGSPPAGRSAWCTATAAYSSQYADWDVYVHSDQPDAAVTASSGTYSKRWHTDASGYADVYLRGPSPGQAIRVIVGSASCSAATG